MFNRFGDDTRKAIQLANQRAQSFRHEYIGTEHLLLGLMDLKDPGVMVALIVGSPNACTTPQEVVRGVEAFLQYGPDMVTMGKLPQTPRAKKVLEYAMQECPDGGVILPTHLLLALIRENEGCAAQVLKNLGHSYDSLKRFIGSGPVATQERQAVRACEKCRFWGEAQSSVAEPKEFKYGLCRIRAPKKSTTWPTTLQYDWCGEYQEK